MKKSRKQYGSRVQVPVLDWHLPKHMRKKGYRLILTARRQGRLEKLAENLGVPCRIETADLFKEKECYRVCEILKEETIDIFINNAGFGNCGDFAGRSFQGYGYDPCQCRGYAYLM